MKNFIYTIIILLFAQNILLSQDEKITFEEIRSSCEGKPFEERVRVTVARFSVSTPDAQGKFGGELSTMLSNALQQTNCFSVLESIKNAEDMTDELGFGASGMTADGSSPQSGKMLGAQVVITGEVTEYNDGRSNLSLGGLSVGSDKARVGFVMKVLNPQTRLVLFSRSINVTGKKNGFTGVQFLGLNVAGGNSQNRAVANAVEHAILEAVSVLAENMDNISLPGIDKVNKPKEYNSNNCQLLASNNPPSVMVIIPEIHIQRKIPDPAGETEIIRQFLKAGFKVIDPSVYNNIRNSDRIKSAASDASSASSIGREYGADIVVIGEAFSERAPDQGSMISCRARVEARAVSTKDASILAAHGTHAGGVDITESSSSKVSLANAGKLMADYLLSQFCEGGNGSSGGASGNSSTSSNTTSVKISRIDFTAFKKIQTALEKNDLISNVTKSFTGKDGTFKVKHSGSTDDVLAIILEVAPTYEVKSYADGKLILTAK